MSDFIASFALLMHKIRIFDKINKQKKFNNYQFFIAGQITTIANKF